MFEELHQLKNCTISKDEEHKVIKVLMLCFLGSFFGHNTLKEIIRAYQCKTDLYGIYNHLSYNDMSQISSHLFKYYLVEELKELGNQSESSWSRANPTYIIDASVYKQWLSEHNLEQWAFFDRFYSGQTHKPEYGFRITLGGIAIKDTFYPLIFNMLPKHIPDSEIASTILLQMQTIVNQIENEHQLHFGQWYLSVDNGYSDNILLGTADKSRIVPICVPKKSHTSTMLSNHIFIINGEKVKLRDYIENEFISKEPEFNQDLDDSQDNAFTLRVKATYKSLGIEVILLIFRYKGSKKVSVIYSTHLSIKEKTLRHHWFQRTYMVTEPAEVLNNSFDFQNMS